MIEKNNLNFFYKFYVIYCQVLLWNNSDYNIFRKKKLVKQDYVYLNVVYLGIYYNKIMILL